jgi:perosamine synthetase
MQQRNSFSLPKSYQTQPVIAMFTADFAMKVLSRRRGLGYSLPMIPRRNLPISINDFKLWLKSIFTAEDNPGERVERFETAFAEYLGAPFVRATASGRDAIELALSALGAKKGDELIVPAYTLGELLPVIQALGIVPIPAEIEPDTFNIDVAAIQWRISEKTRGILATHLLGAPCDIEAICALAAKNDLFVIEDCAHALGATVRDRKVGTFGDAAIFSQEQSKALPTYGGGLLATQDEKVAIGINCELNQRKRNKKPALKKAFSTWIEEAVIRSPLYALLARILFNPKIATHFENAYRGSHDKLRGEKLAYTDFQARIGLERLPLVDARNARLNARWEELAGSLPEGFTPQVRTKIGSPAFYNFVTLSPIAPTDLRVETLSRGVDMGIGSEIEDDCSEILGFKDCPVTRKIAAAAVMLPLYDGLSKRQLRRMLKVLHKAVK